MLAQFGGFERRLSWSQHKIPRMTTVLFACVHNAGRSQMAAAFFNRLADPSQARAISAGTEPAPRLHAEVIAAMQAAGLDVSAARPRKLTPELAAAADLLITMGCGEACPVAPGAEVIDWPVADPKGETSIRVAEIRDEVCERVRALVVERGWKAAGLAR